MRLNNGHQVTIVTIDEIRSVDVLKLVAVVKQGIETKLSQGQERRGLDLKDFKNLELVHVYWRIFAYNISLIGISDTVSDGAAKTLVLNIERAQQDYLSQRF